MNNLYFIIVSTVLFSPLSYGVAKFNIDYCKKNTFKCENIIIKEIKDLEKYKKNPEDTFYGIRDSLTNNDVTIFDKDYYFSKNYTVKFTEKYVKIFNQIADKINNINDKSIISPHEIIARIITNNKDKNKIEISEDNNNIVVTLESVSNGKIKSHHFSIEKNKIEIKEKNKVKENKLSASISETDVVPQSKFTFKNIDNLEDYLKQNKKQYKHKLFGYTPAEIVNIGDKYLKLETTKQERFIGYNIIKDPELYGSIYFSTRTGLFLPQWCLMLDLTEKMKGLNYQFTVEQTNKIRKHIIISSGQFFNNLYSLKEGKNSIENVDNEKYIIYLLYEKQKGIIYYKLERKLSGFLNSLFGLIDTIYYGKIYLERTDDSFFINLQNIDDKYKAIISESIVKYLKLDKNHKTFYEDNTLNISNKDQIEYRVDIIALKKDDKYKFYFNDILNKEKNKWKEIVIKNPPQE